MVSGSASSKELKNAIKSSDLPLLRALEAKVSFKSGKKVGTIFQRWGKDSYTRGGASLARIVVRLKA